MEDSKMAAANDDSNNSEAPKKPKKRAPSVVELEDRQTISTKYKFSEKEKKEIADKMVQRQIDLNSAREEKKAASAAMNDKIERINLDVQKLSRNYKDGYDLRDYNVIVIFDYKKREKRFKDVLTKKIVETLPFAPGDEQRRFI